MTPTAEQSTIVDAAKAGDNLIIHAFAGCGKTSTLELIERASKTRPILFLAFNKKIAEEASDRMQSTTTVRTFNSLGHRIWAKSQDRNLTLDPKKSQIILRDIINELPKRDQGPIWDSYWSIIHGVGLAKALGYIPEGKYPTADHLISRGPFHAALEEEPDDLIADLIDAVLDRSIRQSFDGRIDYNDQVYMPALFGGTFPRFPLVMADEAQDLNPTNHRLLERLVKGQLIVVGDPFQSIYGFRGAVQSGMSKLQKTHGLNPQNLSISFRCPRTIVEASRWRVSNFNWIKEGGHVEVLKSLHLRDISLSSVFISRNNAPLLGLALRLLSVGHSVSVAGSDIGPKLIGTMRKLGPEELTQEQALGAIADWQSERLARGSTTADDQAECMRVFARQGSDLGQSIRYAEHIFAQKGSIRLMTGHKAKGLEFDTVHHLDPWLCRETEQDLNLRYVITTRSMNNYFEINSRDIQ